LEKIEENPSSSRGDQSRFWTSLSPLEEIEEIVAVLYMFPDFSLR
jgi:hypothetical protein